MAVITGLTSSIDGVANGRNWSITPVSEVTEFGDSGTSGAAASVDGIKDWTGTYSAYGHTPLVFPGDDFTFLGSIDGTNGATGAAICDSIEITLNQETMAPIEHVVNFSGDGALTLGAAVDTAEAAALPLTAVAGCVVDIGSSIAVRTSKLTLACDNKAYADTSTAGVKNRAAGRLSGTMSWSRFVDDFADFGTSGDVITVKIYVTAALFWEINYGMYTGPTDLTVDRETGELVGGTENVAFTALNGAGTLGSIKTPAAVPVTKWP